MDRKLFTLWRHGDAEYSTFGPSSMSELNLTSHKNTKYTPDGVLGVCTTNLAGYAIIIPKVVSDILGYWNEDYGLYGSEDGDYGYRMNVAGYTQYYYDESQLLDHVVGYDDYKMTSLDKAKEHRNLFKTDTGHTGLFKVNNYLYKNKIRKLNVPLRYQIKDKHGYEVVIEERKSYQAIREALIRSTELLDCSYFEDKPDFLHEKLMACWKHCDF